jgi:hypothetical protein
VKTCLDWGGSCRSGFESRERAERKKFRERKRSRITSQLA